jgi:hypothetical protein
MPCSILTYKLLKIKYNKTQIKKTYFLDVVIKLPEDGTLVPKQVAVGVWHCVFYDLCVYVCVCVCLFCMWLSAARWLMHWMTTKKNS